MGATADLGRETGAFECSGRVDVVDVELPPRLERKEGVGEREEVAVKDQQKNRLECCHCGRV